MKLRRIKATAVCSSLIFYMSSFVLLVPPADAGWVDDWFTQSTYSGASSFEGQKRGYYTAGGISTRFTHSSDYLATISAPQFKAGCGGIDFFMGGFSFLDMNYLGTKLQNIMTAGAVFAFDIALKTLCEQCSESMKSLEAMVNKLNSLQLEDCKAGKAMVTIAADTLSGETESARAELNAFAVDTGISSFYKDADDSTRTNPATAITQTKSSVTGGDADLDTLLYQQGSLLAKAAGKYGYSTAWTDLARGYVGDLYLSTVNDPLSVVMVEPCEDNSRDESYTDFVEGTALYKPDGSETCTQITDVNKSIRTYVQNTLTSIGSKINSKTALTPAEEDFIRMSPVPVYLHLKMARSGNVDAEFVDVITEDLAYVYAVKMLKDLYEMTDKVLGRYYKDISNKDVTDTVLRDNALGDIKSLRDRLRPEIARLASVLMERKAEYGTTAARFFDRQHEFKRLVRQAMGYNR